MRYRDVERRLEQLEAEAARQSAIVQEEIDEEAEIAAAWQAIYEEMATATVDDLLNRRPEELIVWAELHRPEVAQGMVERVTSAYAANACEQIYAVGSSEWYFDLCRMLEAPYQRKHCLDARWPRENYIYWPRDPLYNRRLHDEWKAWNEARYAALVGEQ